MSQAAYPHDGTRTCTFPGHVGEVNLPASADYFPVRKSGKKAGSFIGWCRDCQKLSAQRHRAEPERQGIRARAAGRVTVTIDGTPDTVRNYGQARPGSLIPAISVAEVTVIEPEPEPAKKQTLKDLRAAKKVAAAA